MAKFVCDWTQVNQVIISVLMASRWTSPAHTAQVNYTCTGTISYLDLVETSRRDR